MNKRAYLSAEYQKIRKSSLRTSSMLYMVMIRQAAFICLADTSEQDTKYQYEKTYRTVDVFADRNELLREFLFSSCVDLLLNIFFATYPEKHDSGKPCAERADVDGQDIHPV